MQIKMALFQKNVGGCTTDNQLVIKYTG